MSQMRFFGHGDIIHTICFGVGGCIFVGVDDKDFFNHFAIHKIARQQQSNTKEKPQHKQSPKIALIEQVIA